MKSLIVVLILAVYVPASIYAQLSTGSSTGSIGPAVIELPNNRSSLDIPSAGGEVRTVYLDSRRVIDPAIPTIRRLPPVDDRRYARYLARRADERRLARYLARRGRLDSRLYRSYLRRLRRRPYSREFPLERRYGRRRRRRPLSSRLLSIRRRLERSRPYYDPYPSDYEMYDDAEYRPRRRRYRSRPRSSRRRDARDEYYPRDRDEEYRSRDSDYPEYRARSLRRGRRRDSEYPEGRRRSVDMERGRDRRRDPVEFIEGRRSDTEPDRRRDIEYRESRRRDTDTDRRRDSSDYTEGRRRGIVRSRRLDSSESREGRRLDVGRGRRRDSVEYRDERRRGSGRSSRSRRVEYDYFEDDPYISERMTDSYLTDSIDSRSNDRGLGRDLIVDDRHSSNRTDYRSPETNVLRNFERDGQANRPSNRQMTESSTINDIGSPDVSLFDTTVQTTMESIDPPQNHTDMSEANSGETPFDATTENLPDGFITNPDASIENYNSITENLKLRGIDVSTPPSKADFSSIARNRLSSNESITLADLKDIITGVNISVGNDTVEIEIPEIGTISSEDGNITTPVKNATKTGKLESANLFRIDNFENMAIDLTKDSINLPAVNLPVLSSNNSFKVILDTMNSRTESQNVPDDARTIYSKPAYNVQPSISISSGTPVNERVTPLPKVSDIPPHLLDERHKLQDSDSQSTLSTERPTVRVGRLSLRPGVQSETASSTESDVVSIERSRTDERLPLRPTLPTSRRYREESLSERPPRDEILLPRRLRPPRRRLDRDRDFPPYERSERLSPRRRPPPPRRYRDDLPRRERPTSERPPRDELLPSRRRPPPPRRYRDDSLGRRSDDTPIDRAYRDERLPPRRRRPRYRDDPSMTERDVVLPERPPRDERLSPDHRRPPPRRYRDERPVTGRDDPPTEGTPRDERRPLRSRPPPSPERAVRDEGPLSRRRRPPPRYIEDPPVIDTDGLSPDRPPLRHRPSPPTVSDGLFPERSLRGEETLPRRRRPPPPRYRDDPSITVSDGSPPERTSREEEPPSSRRRSSPRRYRDDPSMTGSERAFRDDRRPPRRRRPPPRSYRDDLPSEGGDGRRSPPRIYRDDPPPRRRFGTRDRPYRDDSFPRRRRPYRDEPTRRRFRPRERTYRDRPVDDISYESSRRYPDAPPDPPTDRSSSADTRLPTTEAPPTETTTERLRLGVVVARGGVDGYPVHGGYGPGERHADGGVREGDSNGTGTGTLSAFLLRRLAGTNEDITAFKRDLRPVIATG